MRPLAQSPESSPGKAGTTVDAGVEFTGRHHLDLGGPVEVDELDQQELDSVLLDPRLYLVARRHLGSPGPGTNCQMPTILQAVETKCHAARPHRDTDESKAVDRSGLR
ncbi:MAG: hypothetical protein Ct9H300mP1_04220 [Planctomycetaceae bacterium]|nr:MAG: hypothetical protein Ct9H300mP1_04220 [Planctomycetaceae bacterium]